MYVQQEKLFFKKINKSFSLMEAVIPGWITLGNSYWTHENTQLKTYFPPFGDFHGIKKKNHDNLKAKRILLYL